MCKSLGSRKAILLFASFKDLPADPSIFNEWEKNLIPSTEKQLKAMSYGRYEIHIDYDKTFIEVPHSIKEYNLRIAHDASNVSEARIPALVEDSMSAADSVIDFSKYDFVIVATPSSTEIMLGGTIGLNKVADGKIFESAIFTPYSETQNADNYKHISLMHNVGHVLGLMHGFIPDFSNNTRPSAWDVMWNFAAQNDFMGWNQWKLGWISDNQVICLFSPNQKIVEELTPIGKKDEGHKLSIIKLNDYQALAIELREKTPFDFIPPGQEGVIVYLVDTSKGANSGAFTMVSKPNEILRVGPGFEATLGTLSEGESVLIKDYQIKVSSYKKGKAFVEITYAK